MELKYLFEAEKLYQSRRFKACLNLLYEHSCFAKWLNWVLIAVSLLLFSMSLWLSAGQHNAAISAAAVSGGAAIAVAIAACYRANVIASVVAAAAAVSGGAVITIIVVATAADTTTAIAAAAYGAGIAFTLIGFINQFLCRLIIRHEKLSKK